MGDGCTEGTILGAIDINMNPLMIQGDIRKAVYPVLGNFEPLALGSLLSDSFSLVVLLLRRNQVAGVITRNETKNESRSLFPPHTVSHWMLGAPSVVWKSVRSAVCVSVAI